MYLEGPHTHTHTHTKHHHHQRATWRLFTFLLFVPPFSLRPTKQNKAAKKENKMEKS